MGSFVKVIVGLGNPGKDYQKTRHNVGFMVIDEIIKKLNLSTKKIKFNSVYTETIINSEKVLLVKPQTFMNNSGVAVRDIINFFKVDPKDLIVIYDDIDIGFSDVRIRKKGSSGSHNGMKSIIYQIQSDDFPRIRIGVGKKHEEEDLANFVLTNFSKDEFKDIEIAIKYAAEGALSIVDKGIDFAMNNYNRKNK